MCAGAPGSSRGKEDPPAAGTRHAPADDDGAPQRTLNTPAETTRQANIEMGHSQVQRILLAERVRWPRTHS